MGFKKPARTEEGGTQYFKLSNYDGEAALFKVNDEDVDYVNPQFKSDGARPTVWADVTIVTGGDAGKFFPNADISGKWVYNSLAEHVGSNELVLGRIVRGDKGGRPFFINDPEDGDEELAEALLANEQAAIPGEEENYGDDEDVPY